MQWCKNLSTPRCPLPLQNLPRCLQQGRVFLLEVRLLMHGQVLVRRRCEVPPPPPPTPPLPLAVFSNPPRQHSTLMPLRSSVGRGRPRNPPCASTHAPTNGESRAARLLLLHPPLPHRVLTFCPRNLLRHTRKWLCVHPTLLQSMAVCGSRVESTVWLHRVERRLVEAWVSSVTRDLGRAGSGHGTLCVCLVESGRSESRARGFSARRTKLQSTAAWEAMGQWRLVPVCTSLAIPTMSCLARKLRIPSVYSLGDTRKGVAVSRNPVRPNPAPFLASAQVVIPKDTAGLMPTLILLRTW
mmetsp:Transcript_46834/g.117341  ORF Transcript_46834/g.117341 Transcript_46834/m.117341 type:complete len:298 (+) Transcript_46834:588-1481(+)